MTMKESEKNDKAIDKLVSGLEKELRINYEASLKNIRKQLVGLYEKTDGSFVDAVKYNRLSAIEDQIGKEIMKLTGLTAETLKRGISETFVAAKMREVYAIEKSIGFATDFSLMNKKAINAAIKNPYDRIGFINRNKFNAELLARQVRQEITQGLIQGKSFQQTARDLKRRMEIGAGKARTIVQTETHRVRGVAKSETQEEAVGLGINIKKMWVASIDDATRDAHQMLDGLTIDIDEDFYSETGGQGPGPGEMNTAEDDINCRCTKITVIEGFEPSVRRVRGEGIVKFETFKEWEKTRDIPVRG